MGWFGWSRNLIIQQNNFILKLSKMFTLTCNHYGFAAALQSIKIIIISYLTYLSMLLLLITLSY